MARQLKHIRFDALRNAIYHTARRGYFDFLTRFLSLVVVAGGAGAIVSIANNFIGIPPEIFAGAAALAGIFQLVFDSSGKARDHEFLQRRFYGLVAEMSEAQSPSDKLLAKWDAALHRLYAEERPPMRALDAIAYNAAVDALGHNKEERIRLKWRHSIWCHFLPFNDTSFNDAGGVFVMENRICETGHET